MDPMDEKLPKEEEVTRTEQQNEDIQTEPQRESQVDTVVASEKEGSERDGSGKDVLEREAIQKDVEQPAPLESGPRPHNKYLSIDLDEQGRPKRESIESRNLFRMSYMSDSTEHDETDTPRPDLPLSTTDPNRPPHSRGETIASAISTTTSRRSLPSLRRRETKLAQKEAHPWQHLGITLGLPMILLFDLIIPCIIYYTWYYSHVSRWETRCKAEYPDQQPCPEPKPEYDSDILGYAIVCFGFGELWILIARVWRLVFRQQECAPLLSRSRWELDATCWVYGVAMILALIPFVVGSTLEMPILYLYSPSFIMGFLGILMFITTFVPFTIPIGINSHARGTRLRPFIYYAAEDFVAVDGLQDREFRVRYNERYDTNKRFRRFFVHLTLWWILGVCVYIGSVSAVIFTLEFHYAFGLSFGVLFSYIAIWATVTAVWVKVEMKREHREYEEGEVEA